MYSHLIFNNTYHFFHSHHQFYQHNIQTYLSLCFLFFILSIPLGFYYSFNNFVYTFPKYFLLINPWLLQYQSKIEQKLQRKLVHVTLQNLILPLLILILNQDHFHQYLTYYLALLSNNQDQLVVKHLLTIWVNFQSCFFL